MAPLHNRISQKELKERLLQESDPRTTISFYHYFGGNVLLYALLFPIVFSFVKASETINDKRTITPERENLII